MKSYFKLLRVHHYLKNLLVFAALACSGQFFDITKLTSAVVGFFAFCAAASVVYIINDIRDAEKDRNHPKKSTRPIASGKVSVRVAYVLAAILVVVAAVCCFIAKNMYASLLLGLYLFINIGYSLGLKTLPLVDITLLVAGFLIRIVFGAVLTGIEISNWLYLTVIAVAFYFALGKRRNELKQLGDGTREVLKSYTVAFLDKSMLMCLTLANVFYALWSMDENTVLMYDTKYLIFTVPIVLLITMKYSLDIEGESDGDPIDVLLHDKILIALCAIYLAVMFLILYL